MKNSLKYLAALSLIFIFTSYILADNSTVSVMVRGTITDESGAAIVAARVSLRSASNLTRETVTDESGHFILEKVQSGDYVLIVDQNGFTGERRNVKIGSTSETFDVVLKIAPVSEVVTVTNNQAEGAVETTLKLPGTLKETPRSVSVVSADRIREQNFRQASDVLNYAPGQTVNSYRTGGYHFYSRGNRMGPNDTRIDGNAGISVSGGYSAHLFGVEEVVLLRGPAGLIYGATGLPGGFINIITKKPREARSTRIDVRGGSFAGNNVSFSDRGSIGLDFDSTGALPWTDRILYRTLFSIENQNYFTNDVLDRNRYASGMLTFKLDEDGRYQLTPLLQWTRFNRPYGGGIVISPTTSLTTNDNLTSINENDLSPLDVNLYGGDRIDEQLQTGLDFRAVPTNKLQLNASYRYITFDTDINQFSPQVSSAAQRTLLTTQNLVERVQAKNKTDRRHHNLSADATYELRSAGWWKNLTQIGFYNLYTETRDGGFTSAPQSPINIYTGRTLTPLTDVAPALALSDWSGTNSVNGYVQNRTALINGKLIFTVGLGYGQTDPPSGEVQKSDLLPNFSAVYNVTDHLAVYGSYATSFNPVDPSLEDARGKRGVFDPVKGENYELGAKFDLPLRRTFFTFAVFQNEVDNALVQSGAGDLNPNGNRFYVAAGARRSRGAEATIETSPLRNLTLSSAATYTDAIYLGEGPASAVGTIAIPGSSVEKTPRWSYNVWSRYDVSEGTLKGFGAGLGFIYQGKRLGSNGARTPSAPDPLVLPSFYRVDAGLFYRLNKHWDFSMNVENLFDNLIFVNASVGSNIEVAAPRSFTFKTGYRF